MPITGKAAFDLLAAKLAPLVDQNYTRGGATYRLTSVASVSGPYSASVKVGIYGLHEIVRAGVDALVVRYSCDAPGKRVDPVNDMRVLLSAEVPDNATDAQLVEIGRQFLEDAR
jgi:hypothetical protein